jgi:hypothetical protein
MLKAGKLGFPRLPDAKTSENENRAGEVRKFVHFGKFVFSICQLELGEDEVCVLHQQALFLCLLSKCAYKPVHRR